MNTYEQDQVQGRSTQNGLYGHGHIGFLANHTSIGKPHPLKFRVRDCVLAMQVWFLAENGAEISNQPYQPNTLNFWLMCFGKPSKYMYM